MVRGTIDLAGALVLTRMFFRYSKLVVVRVGHLGIGNNFETTSTTPDFAIAQVPGIKKVQEGIRSSIISLDYIERGEQK